MAILNNLVVHGTSRFLNTLYANDLTVGGTTTFSTLDVTGAATIAGTLTLSKTQDAAGTSDNKPALIVGNPTGVHLELDTNEIMAKASATTTGALTINNDGGSVSIAPNGTTYMGKGSKIHAADGTFTAVDYNGTNYTGTNATFDSGKITNLMVTDTLRSFKWDIDHVANLGGNFLVTPSIIFESGKTAQVTRSGSTLTISITDSGITSSIGGIAWTANSTIKAAGKINNIAIGNCDGTITSINTSTNTMIIQVTSEADVSGFATTATSYTIQELTVMLTKVSGTNPIGIYMTASDPNAWPAADSQGKASISIYGGTAPGTGMTATTPVARLGYLGGLPAINGVTPSGWGLYTNHGYFSGLIVSNEGKIGNFTISNALYSSTHSAYNTNVDGVYLGSDYISVGKQGAAYLKADGTGKIGRYTFASNGEFTTTVSNNTAGMGNATYAFWAGATSANAANAPFSVTYAGAIKSTSGTIGGYTIDSTSLYSGTKGNSTTSGHFTLTTGTFTRAIDGTSRSNLQMALGAKFGVANDGTLYANGANITNINASNIKTGYLSADRIEGGSLSIGKINSTDQSKILNDNIEVGGRNLLLGEPSTYSQSAYNAYIIPATIALSDLSEGDQLTIQLWDVSVDSNSTGVGVYWGGGYIRLSNLLPDSNGYYLARRTVTANDLAQNGVANKFIHIYNIPNGHSGASLSIGRWKIERGNKPTDWSPAPEDTDAQIESVSERTSEFIVGTQAAATRFWTGVSQTLTELTDGTQITYWLPFPYASETAESKGITAAELDPAETITSKYNNDWLKLTLANGTDTGWVPCYYSNITRITSHYGQNNAIRLTYKTGVTSGTTTVSRGWWADANYDSNTYDRTRYNVNITTNVAIAAGRIGVFGTDGYLKMLGTTSSNMSFDFSKPIVYVGTEYKSGAMTQSGNYTCFMTAFTLTNTHAVAGAAAGKPVYIVGTLSGTTFTPTSTVLTCTEPASADNLYYIRLGVMTSTTNAVLEAEHPLYAFMEGEFQRVDTAATKSATNYITYINATDGIKVHNANEMTDYVQINSSAISFFRNNSERTKIEDAAVRVGGIGSNIRNVYITNSAVQIRNNTSVLAEYGSTISLYQPGTTTKAVEITGTGLSVANGTLTGSALTTSAGDQNNYEFFNGTVTSSTTSNAVLTRISSRGVQSWSTDGSTVYAQMLPAYLTITESGTTTNRYGWYITPATYARYLYTSGDSTDSIPGLVESGATIANRLDSQITDLLYLTEYPASGTAISGINGYVMRVGGVAVLNFASFSFAANTGTSATTYRLPSEFYPKVELDLVSTHNQVRFRITTQGYIRPYTATTAATAIRGTFTYMTDPYWHKSL